MFTRNWTRYPPFLSFIFKLDPDTSLLKEKKQRMVRSQTASWIDS